MKTIIVKLLIVWLSLSCIHTTSSQDLLSNGNIHYKMDVIGSTDPNVQQMFKEAKMEVGFLDGKSRFELQMPMVRTRGFTTGDSLILLMDMMGTKMMMTVGNEYSPTQRISDEEYEVISTKETKKIAGYSSKKYIVKMKDGQSFVVYTTEQLPIKAGTIMPYGKIKGAPLEYEVSQGPYKMRVTADSITFGTESKEKHTADTAGYMKMSPDQMKGLMQLNSPGK